MPKAWFCIPSARPIAEVLPVVQRWREMGYGVALQRDRGGEEFTCDGVGPNLVFERAYQGYAEAVNFLSAEVLRNHPEVDWICTGGDDTFPDPNKTGDEIAAELSQDFAIKAMLQGLSSDEEFAKGCPTREKVSTFGVCQPTGDRWADNLGVIIERIAGSPWLGREWCRRANAGKGPLWPEFAHMFVDEHCMQYAQSLGVFLQRPDLTHHHAHAQRDGKSQPAPHMKEWNSQKHWQESKAIFERLKSTNFAECQPIP